MAAFREVKPCETEAFHRRRRLVHDIHSLSWFYRWSRWGDGMARGGDAEDHDGVIPIDRRSNLGLIAPGNCKELVSMTSYFIVLYFV